MAQNEKVKIEFFQDEAKHFIAKKNLELPPLTNKGSVWINKDLLSKPTDLKGQSMDGLLIEVQGELSQKTSEDLFCAMVDLVTTCYKTGKKCECVGLCRESY